MAFPSQERCPRCGTVLCDVNSGLRVCPRCELAGMLGEGDAASLPFSGAFGSYDLEALIAHGGMGAVYRARHRDTGRLVALKTLLAGRLANEEMRDRFLRETRLAAKLRHPHIVPLLDVGEADGLPYIVMEFVPGRNLADTLRDGPLPPRQAAALLTKIVQAVAHAHGQGVLHRDLKPANILIDAAGEPRVADFGLARLIDQDLATELTVTGQLLGSPGYLAPERVPRESAVGAQGGDTGGAASDVYSLGATLYHLLAGRPPFQGATLEAVLMQVVQTEPINPGKLNPGVPPGLEAICLKCLEKEPRRRYASAQALADDLQRFVDGRPVHARLPGLAARAWRWCRRRPIVAGLSVVVVVLLFAVVAISVSAALRGRRDEARLRTQLAESLLAQARALVKSSQVGRRAGALEAIRQVAKMGVTPELRREAFAALALPDLRIEREIDLGHDANSVWLDPGFTRCAVSLPLGAIEIRSVPDLRLLQTLPASTNLHAYLLQFSPDGRYLGVKRDHQGGGVIADLEVWDLHTTQRVVLARQAVTVNALSFHPRAPRILVGRPDGRLVTWDLESGTQLYNWPGRYSFNACYSPDGNFIANARSTGPDRPSDDEGVVEVMGASNGTVLVTAKFYGPPRNLRWHPDGQSIAVPGMDGIVRLMNAQDGTLRALGAHKAQATWAEIPADGEFLFTSGWDNEIKVWNLRTFQLELTATSENTRIQFATDGRRAAVFLRPRRLQLLEFSRSAECRELAADLTFGLGNGSFSADGRWLGVGMANRLALWDLTRPERATVFDEAGIGSVFFRSHERELVARSDRRLYRWRLAGGAPGSSGPLLDPLPAYAPDFPLRSMRAVQQGVAMVLAASNALHLVALTNLATGAGVRISGTFRYADVSRDGRLLATAGPRQAMVSLRSTPEFTMERSLICSAPVRGLAFAPSGEFLAILTEREVGLWNTTTLQVAHRRPVAADGHGELTYTMDGRILIMRENSRNGSLLDGRNLELLLAFPTWTHPIAMTSDSRQLAISVDSRRVQLWDFAAVRATFRALGIDWDNSSGR